jgi:hypothetical protein
MYVHEREAFEEIVQRHQLEPFAKRESETVPLEIITEETIEEECSPSTHNFSTSIAKSDPQEA